MRQLIFYFTVAAFCVNAQQQLTNFGNLAFHRHANVSLKGDFQNNGQLIDSANSVLLNGSQAQLLKGTSATVLRNLILDNQSGAAITTSVSISKELNIVAGTFSALAHPLVLLSDQQTTARIAPITGDITGNITMQRYLPKGSTGWRFLASPVYSATINEWQDDFITSGFPGSTYPTFNFTSIYTYDETVAGHFDNGFVSPKSANDLLENGQGYWCYIGPVPLTFEVTGPAGKFNRSFPVTFSKTATPADDGWYMIGNPYPSAIDWNSGSWTKTNINSAIYIWNPELQQFASYINGSGTNGGSNVIPSSQSFWVQANAANPVLNCNEQVKTATDQSFLKPSPTFMNQTMRLAIAGNGFTDECVIRFGQPATNGYDVDADARKFYSSNTAVPSIASSDTTGDQLSVNSLAPLSNAQLIPVTASVQVSGVYTISINLDDFQTTADCFILEDLVTSESRILDVSKTFTCFLSDTLTSARFIIHARPAPEAISKDATCSYYHDGKILIDLKTKGTWKLDYLNEKSQLIGSNATGQITDSLNGLQAGTYFVHATETGGSCPASTLTVIVNSTAPILAGFSLSSDTLVAGTGSLVITNQSTGAQQYQWDFGDKTTDTLYNPTHTYLHQGDYLLNLIALNKQGCSDTTATMVHVKQTGVITGGDIGAADLSWELFPNPSTGLVKVKGTIISDQTELKFYTSDGKLVKTSTLTRETNSIDLSDFARGIYFYQVGENAPHKKLVIQ